MLLRFLTAFCFAALAVPPCRFTVRDVAFVDLGDPPYRLYGVFSAGDGAEQRETFSRLAAALYVDANVEAVVIDADAGDNPASAQQLGHPARAHLAAARAQRGGGADAASPTLAFAVLGQGRADRLISPENESTTISRLLTHWAARRTAQAEYACVSFGQLETAAALGNHGIQ